MIAFSLTYAGVFLSALAVICLAFAVISLARAVRYLRRSIDTLASHQGDQDRQIALLHRKVHSVWKNGGKP